MRRAYIRFLSTSFATGRTIIFRIWREDQSECRDDEAVMNQKRPKTPAEVGSFMVPARNF